MSIIRGSAMEFIRNFDYMSREEKTCMYLINMRPVLNSRGLFHDCTEEYLSLIHILTLPTTPYV